MSDVKSSSRRFRTIKRVVFYAGVLIALFFYTRWLASNTTYPIPSAEVPSPPPFGLTEVQIPGPRGTIHGWQAEPESVDSKTPLMVFFHGNAENLATLHASGFLGDVIRRGIGILAIDYPGYGRSEGRTSEESLIEAGRRAVRYAAETHPERPLLISGWSLGAAVAIQVSAANEIPHRALLLVSPWTSLKAVAEQHFPKWLVRVALTEQYDSLAAAARVEVPVLVIHGTHDQIIPITQGYQVSDAVSKSTFLPAPLSGHNDITGSESFWMGLVALVEKYLAEEEITD